MEIKLHKTEFLPLALIKILPCNRIINLKHVTSLLNSMMKYGIIRKPVIVRTSLFGKLEDYILDGQHMIAALNKVNHKTVECIIIEDNDISNIINTMATLNNSSLPWKVEDYVNAYCELPGKSDYKLLKVHHLATGFNYTVSSKILSGSAQVIRNGTFKVNCTDADEITKQVIEITSLYNTNNSKFMMAYITFKRGCKKYDHKKFMQLAAINKDSFPILHDTVVMVNAFNAFYNI